MHASAHSVTLQVKPPRVEEAAVQLECKLAHTYDVKNSKGEVTSTIIIGEVVLIHVLEAVTTRTGHGHVIVDFDKYAPVSRLGGNTYARITETYDLPRPGKEWQERAFHEAAAK
jgi:flavin reductase (DIM6/NTAB) family NADH-FMN oxidoreductase RutF